MNSVAAVLSAGSTATTSAKPATNPSGNADASAFESILQGTPMGSTHGDPSAETPQSLVSDELEAEASGDGIDAHVDAGAEKAAPLELDTESPEWPPLGLSALLMPPPQTPPTVSAAAPINSGGELPASTTPATNPATLSVSPPISAPAMSDTLAETDIALELAKPPANANASVPDGVEPAATTSLIQGMTAVNITRIATEPAVALSAPTATPELGSEGFDDAVGARIGWLVDQKISHAHIRITPHDMGTIEVRLQIDGDRVHASFSSAHAEVRQALETGLGRLREMLGEQGLELARADVGQQSTSNDHASSSNHLNADEVSPDTTAAGGKNGPATPIPMRQIGLLDTYA